MRQTNQWQLYPVKHLKHLELNRTAPKHWTQDKPSKQMNNSKTSLKFPRSGWCTKKNKTHHEYSATAVKGDRPHNRCLFKALIDPYWGLVLQKTLCIHLSWGPGISPFSQWTFTVAMAGQRLEPKICCCFHQWIPIWWRWNDISWNYKNKSLNSGISAICKHTHWSSPPACRTVLRSFFRMRSSVPKADHARSHSRLMDNSLKPKNGMEHDLVFCSPMIVPCWIVRGRWVTEPLRWRCLASDHWWFQDVSRHPNYLPVTYVWTHHH